MHATFMLHLQLYIVFDVTDLLLNKLSQFHPDMTCGNQRPRLRSPVMSLEQTHI